VRRRRILQCSLAAGFATLAGCLDRDEPRPTVDDADAGSGGPTWRPPAGDLTYGYTHVRPTGNRVVEGPVGLPTAEPTTVGIDGAPRWIATAPDVRSGDRRAGLWCVVRADGVVDLFRIAADGSPERVPVDPGSLPEGTPPLLAVGSDGARVVPPPDGGSRLTHPIVVGDRTVYVDGDGGLVVLADDGARVGRLAVDALPDARLVTDGTLVFVLAGGTDRYGHGALGDGIEADRVAVIDPASSTVRATLDPPGEAVIEGLSPLLAGLGGDGDPRVVVTESTGEDGARIAAYDAEGSRVVAGPGIGTGNRWRHQVAVAPFGPDGTGEVAVVRTPHIGGTVEFYRPDGDRLAIAATEEGYSSHAYRSRNLSGGLGVVDGDRATLVVPTDERTELAGVERTPGSARRAWTVDVGGTITANVAAAPYGDRTAVGTARRGELVVW